MCPQKYWLVLSLFAAYNAACSLEAQPTNSYCFLHSLLGLALMCAAQLHHQDHRCEQGTMLTILCVFMFFLFWVANMMVMPTDYLYLSLNFVSVLAVSHVAFWYLFIFAQNSLVSSEILRILDNYYNCPGVLPE